jgi:glutamyl-tRNA reductase
LSERDAERVEALARAVMNRLLHEPTARVRSLDAADRHARLSLLRELFGLEDAAAADADEAAEVRRLHG